MYKIYRYHLSSSHQRVNNLPCNPLCFDHNYLYAFRYHKAKIDWPNTHNPCRWTNTFYAIVQISFCLNFSRYVDIIQPFYYIDSLSNNILDFCARSKYKHNQNTKSLYICLYVYLGLRTLLFAVCEVCVKPIYFKLIDLIRDVWSVSFNENWSDNIAVPYCPLAWLVLVGCFASVMIVIMVYDQFRFVVMAGIWALSAAWVVAIKCIFVCFVSVLCAQCEWPGFMFIFVWKYTL